jgi:hypothetical protein
MYIGIGIGTGIGICRYRYRYRCQYRSRYTVCTGRDTSLGILYRYLLTWDTCVDAPIGPSRPIAGTAGGHRPLALLLPSPTHAALAAAVCSGVGRTGA